MIPYATFTYVALALLAGVPSIVLGVGGRLVSRTLLTRMALLVATAGMLTIQYSGRFELWPTGTTREIWLVLGFAALQWLTAVTFLRARSRINHPSVFLVALAFGLAPLIATKLVPSLAPETTFGFLGISYVTFRVLDVIFGIQDRLITSLPPMQLAAYVFFFPTISAGPIDRYRRFAQDWERQRDRPQVLADLDVAIHHVFTGLLYKFILAALIRDYWMTPASTAEGFLSGVSYMYAYSLYLFFDFAGYSAFAVGLSYLFGIRTPENFARPFLARDIRDFWERWHISLSTWFRDHVYMRSVLAMTKRRWFRSRHTSSYIGFVLTFGLMGLWHGVALHYLLYGLYHAALLIGHDLFTRWNKRRRWWGQGRVWQAAGVLLTVHAVCFGFLIFSGRLT
jgi:membrane protein involved in D-alanine export